MPAAPRLTGKAKNILYSLLGKPVSDQPYTARQRRIDKTILYQSISRRGRGV